MIKLIVSACLAGIPCRYDGKDNTDPEIAELAARGEACCICPECLGGLPFRREPSEIVGGDGAAVLNGSARVLDRQGRDVTRSFLQGAETALAIAQDLGVKRAILKARSPSCGAGRIYDGSFSQRLVEGDGVTAALFRARGIPVESR